MGRCHPCAPRSQRHDRQHGHVPGRPRSAGRRRAGAHLPRGHHPRGAEHRSCPFGRGPHRHRCPRRRRVRHPDRARRPPLRRQGRVPQHRLRPRGPADRPGRRDRRRDPGCRVGRRRTRPSTTRWSGSPPRSPNVSARRRPTTTTGEKRGPCRWHPKPSCARWNPTSRFRSASATGSEPGWPSVRTTGVSRRQPTAIELRSRRSGPPTRGPCTAPPASTGVACSPRSPGS